MTTTTTNGISASFGRGLIAATVISAATAGASADLTSDVVTVIEDGVTGGTYGFMLKEVDGPVLTAVNEEFLFYPASSIKVVQHVHAMLQVEQDDQVDLETSVFVYVDPEDQCDDDHAGQEYLDQTLSETLETMMVNSGNGNTNAIQDFFGRAAINTTAHDVIGLSDQTELNHKFGGVCGGPQENANQFPLVDALLLYEKIARNQVFSDVQTKEQFYDLMLSDDNSAYFNFLAQQERPEHMNDDAYDAFRAGIKFARKGGSWTGGIQSQIGWVFLPAPPCNDGTPREFTFGVFVDFPDAVEEDFEIWHPVYELLRSQVREKMLEWTACTNCGTGGECDTPSEGPGCDTGSCCEIVCALDPSCCTTAWDDTCVGLAFNECDLFAQHNTCEDAKPITSSSGSGDFQNTSNNGPSHPGCGWDGEFMKDKWFSYTADKTGHLEIQSLAGFETWVAVYDTSQCPVSANDLLDCHAFAPDAVDDRLETCAVVGQTYLIRLGVANNEDGYVVLHVDNEVGYANYGSDETSGGIGLANEITADDFELPCDDNPYDDLNLSVVNVGPDGPPSSLHWFLYESNAVGTAPGLQIASGAAVDMQVSEIDIEPTAGGSESFYELSFNLGSSIDLLEPGTTYWFGFAAPGVRPLSATEQTGASAQSLSLGTWQPAGGDFAFSIGEGPIDTPCQGDTDGNFVVDIDDVVNVLLDFNSAAPSNGGDVDGDGIVGIDDLVLTILNWGPCVTG